MYNMYLWMNECMDGCMYVRICKAHNNAHTHTHICAILPLTWLISFVVTPTGEDI